MQLLWRVFGLWTGGLLWTVHYVQGELRTTIWRSLSYFVENWYYRLTALERRSQLWSMSNLVSENKSIDKVFFNKGLKIEYRKDVFVWTLRYCSPFVFRFRKLGYFQTNVGFLSVVSSNIRNFLIVDSFNFSSPESYFLKYIKKFRFAKYKKVR